MYSHAGAREWENNPILWDIAIMHTFNTQQLLMILTSLKHYHDHLVEQIENMDSDNDEYGLLTDDILYLNNLIFDTDEMYAKQYKEQFGSSPPAIR